MVSVNNNLFLSIPNSGKTQTGLAGLLKVGQVLTANIQPISPNQAKLTIGNQTLLAATKQPIQENGVIQLRVKQTQPELQLTVAQPKNDNGAKQLQQSIQAVYRQFIPNQAPLSQTVQQISLLPSLPASLQAPVQQLLNQMSRAQQPLNADSLKQKFLDSGLFLESKLNQQPNKINPASLHKDLKAQVLQLQQQVQSLHQNSPSSTLSKLSGLLEQALSRLTVQQIQLLETPQITPLEIPVLKQGQVNEDKVEIRKKRQADQNVWEAYIDLTLPQGQLSTKLKLAFEDHIECYLWCETPALHQEVEARLQELEQLLRQSSYQQVKVQLVPNKPPKTENSTQVTLIDIQV